MSTNRQAETSASPWRAPLLFAVVILLIVLWFAVRLVLRERKRRRLGLPDPDARVLLRWADRTYGF